jgi:hypothetical protein
MLQDRAKTCKEICEAWVKYNFPELNQHDLEELAKQFYEASSDGSLCHVVAAAQQLRELGVEGFK